MCDACCLEGALFEYSLCSFPYFSSTTPSVARLITNVRSFFKYAHFSAPPNATDYTPFSYYTRPFSDSFNRSVSICPSTRSTGETNNNNKVQLDFSVSFPGRKGRQHAQ